MARNTISTLRSALAWPFNMLSTAIDIILCLPVLGRLGKWAWNYVLTLVHLILGLIEWLFILIGFQPTKKMRVGVLILRDEDGRPVVDTPAANHGMQVAVDIFRQANIELIPATNTAPQWAKVLSGPASKRLLDVGCNLRSILEDFWATGAAYQYHIGTQFHQDGFRRLFGFGSPVTVIIVRSIQRFGGCSLGPFADYVTIKHNRAICIAHELGHACNLPHINQDENLMSPIYCRENVKLAKWQIALMRSSRHVTYI